MTQIKDITDEFILEAIRATRGRHGVEEWSVDWELMDHVAPLPPKVVRAKIANMIARGLVNGCTCGCRGDYEIVGELDVERRT